MTPDALLHIPQWQFVLLARSAPALEADESLAAAPLSLLGQMKERDRRRHLRDWERQARPLRGFPPAAEPVEIIEQDAEKAAAWFAEQGIIVDG